MGKHSAGKRDNIMAPSRFDLQVRLAASQATSMASRRRTTRKIGAAAGGLLGLALLPLAIAHADDWTVSPGPLSNETITGIYGYGFGGSLTTPPSVSGSIQGYGLFDYNDVTGNSGEFNGIESTSHDGLGDVNQAVYVTSDVSGTDAPSTGSVFDTSNIGDGAVVNVYSDIYSPSGDTITDTVETPFGNYSIPTTFDAAKIDVADAGGVTIGNGYVGNGDIIDPAGSQTVNAVTGIPPLFIADQGSQQFYVDGSDSPAFNADNTITQDVLGTDTEAVLVTSDAQGAAGGDVPADGSIFNTIDYGGIQNVYSDLTSTTGGADVITDTLDTPTGDYIIPITFDAAKAETTSAINLPDGADLTPEGTFDYSGINGLPPENVSVQGMQTFDYTDGDSSGTLNADVTNTLDLFGNTDETVLVASSTDSEVPAGSVYETVSWADTGVETIYSDIPSVTGGADTIADTLVTPWGDFAIPVYLDAAAGLATDSFSGI
jgi:hypothetical protein